MTVRELLDKYGYTYSRKDCSLIGHQVKKATLYAGKRTYEYIPEGNYFVVSYEEQYSDLILQTANDFFTGKAERVSKDEARRKEIEEANKASSFNLCCVAHLTTRPSAMRYLLI